MRSKLFDSPLITRIEPRFINKKRINKLVVDSNYQIVEINWKHEWVKNHILFATHFTPTSFRHHFEEKLNRNKKIVLFGAWRHLVAYYRILDFHNYKVYLVK